MANEIGTTLLNTLTNSTFDSGNMAKVLAEAGVASSRSNLESKQTSTTTELSALSYLQSNVEAFQSYLSDLSSPTLFQSRSVTSSDDSVISIQSNGVPVTGAYQVKSLQLAQSHTLVANQTFSSASDTLSTGTLSIGVGGQTQSIVIDSSNNTLEGLQSIINNGNYGVSASIINNGGNYQLMFSSKESGAASEISVSGLTEFDTSGFTTTSEAQDALMSINGLVVSNNSNTFDDVIDGLQINLKSTSQSTQSLSVASDAEGITNTISDFVDVYNQLDTILDDLGSYKQLTDEEAESEDNAYFGDLAGSSLLRDLKSQIRESLSGAIPQLTDPNTLASAGLSFDTGGQLSLDTTVLNNLVTNNLEGLANVFAKNGKQLADDNEKRKKRRHKCFQFVFPIDFIMPDDSSITLNSKEDWSLIRDWYDANPNTTDRPEFVFPVDITLEDGTVQTLIDRDELKVVKDSCKKGKDKRKCFKLVLPVLIGIVALVLIYGFGMFDLNSVQKLFAVIGSALAASYSPEIFLSNKTKKRNLLMQNSLPDMLDLLVICAEAGLTLDAAMMRVVREMGQSSPDLCDEFNLTAIELGFLPERRIALQNLAHRVSLPSIKAVTATLIQSEKYGTPLAQSLKVLSDEFRNERFMKAEEKAARLPAVMTVPLIMFILPTLFVVLMGPATCQINDKFINGGI